MIKHEGNKIYVEGHGFVERSEDGSIKIHLDNISPAMMNFLSIYFHSIHYEQNPEQIQVHGRHISEFSNYLEELASKKKEGNSDGE